MKRSLFIFISVVTIFNGCKHELLDPCKAKQPVTAHFTIYETVDSPWEGWYEGDSTDTVLVSAEFRALEKDAKYTWKIGTGIYHTQTVALDFRNSGLSPYSTIPVTCIVEKEPNKSCFPNDDGKDTFKKNVTVAFESPSVFGTFQAQDPEDPTKTWTFRIFDTIIGTGNYINFDNIPKGIPKGVILDRSRVLGGYKVTVISTNVDGDKSPGRYESFILIRTWLGDDQFDCRYEWKIFNNKWELQQIKTYNFRATKIK